ncbi:MAG: DUF1823 family protein [Synechococcus sp.]
MPLWPLSRALLQQILDDRTSDRFVAERVWERLGYRPSSVADGVADGSGRWLAGPETPDRWRQAFPEAPEVIATRPASVALTRSVPKPFKQLLKEQLGFKGYTIGELYPRRTRRATAVNWLLAWLAERREPLLDEGPRPEMCDPPLNPVSGHPGDLPVS